MNGSGIWDQGLDLSSRKSSALPTQPTLPPSSRVNSHIEMDEAICSKSAPPAEDPRLRVQGFGSYRLGDYGSEPNLAGVLGHDITHRLSRFTIQG